MLLRQGGPGAARSRASICEASAIRPEYGHQTCQNDVWPASLRRLRERSNRLFVTKLSCGRIFLSYSIARCLDVIPPTPPIIVPVVPPTTLPTVLRSPWSGNTSASTPQQSKQTVHGTS